MREKQLESDNTVKRYNFVKKGAETDAEYLQLVKNIDDFAVVMKKGYTIQKKEGEDFMLFLRKAAKGAYQWEKTEL